jgi:3-oxoacyl-[acyl-carrier protein] reductase
MEIVQADLGTREGADSLVAWLRAKDLLPHRIVHLPALRLRYQRPKGLDVKRFETDMSVQVQSLMVIAGACLPGMAARCANDSAMPNGKLVGVCSSVVLGVPPRYTVPYTTVKYAQLGLLKALAADYAGQRVNINIVSPSMIATQFLTELPAKAVEMAAARHPMGRNALPSDVIPTIEHLLSPASDFLTGVNIPITGGETG